MHDAASPARGRPSTSWGCGPAVVWLRAVVLQVKTAEAEPSCCRSRVAQGQLLPVSPGPPVRAGTRTRCDLQVVVVVGGPLCPGLSLW